MIEEFDMNKKEIKICKKYHTQVTNEYLYGEKVKIDITIDFDTPPTNCDKICEILHYFTRVISLESEYDFFKKYEIKDGD